MQSSQLSIVQEIEKSTISMIRKNKFGFNSKEHQTLKEKVAEWKFTINSSLSEGNYQIIVPFSLKPFLWPALSYGNLDSLCFFSELELGVWISYLATGNYEKFWDVGSHHGIDSIMMTLMQPACNVISFEPDPDAFKTFNSVIKLNNLANKIKPNNAGLSFEKCKLAFIKVHGNTTASHIHGAREFHGPITEQEVEMHSYENYPYPDFAKINIEGYEKVLIPRLSKKFLQSVNMLVEIHSTQDMLVVLETCKNNDLEIYTQSSGFRRFEETDDLPTSNKDGYIFITKSNKKCALNVENLINRAHKYS
jgi:FkbM family methyltransferase